MSAPVSSLRRFAQKAASFMQPVLAPLGQATRAYNNFFNRHELPATGFALASALFGLPVMAILTPLLYLTGTTIAATSSLVLPLMAVGATIATVVYGTLAAGALLNELHTRAYNNTVVTEKNTLGQTVEGARKDLAALASYETTLVDLTAEQQRHDTPELRQKIADTFASAATHSNRVRVTAPAPTAPHATTYTFARTIQTVEPIQQKTAI